ncbi:retrotransposon ORF1 [Tanacetum coccineum]
MEFQCTNSGTTAKLPILKLGEYEMWVIRIKQYFQIQDYALWDVIENGRKAKLRNDILMFQQHHAESLSEAWTRFKDLLQKVPHHGINLWLQVQIFYDHVNPITRRTIDQLTGVVPTTLCIAWKIPNKPSLNTHPHIPMKRESPNDGEGTTMEGPAIEYFNMFLTRDELTYHKYLMSGPIPSISLRNPIITEGCPSNLKIPCNIGHVHIKKAYIDLNSPLNIMTRMMYNRIMRRKLNPKEDSNGGVSNFMGRIKGMDVFIGNFTYVIDFMIVEDISSILDPRLSQVVLGRPFIEISDMTHDPPEGVVRFIKGTNEVAYKMPHKIEQYDSLSDLEKEHTKSVYLRNKEDKRRGVEFELIVITMALTLRGLAHSFLLRASAATHAFPG